jgi:hypothetical protein
MGNRATVIFTDGKGEFSPAIYLHWNGGPESVYGFLEEMNRRHIRGADDLQYQAARFVQIVGEFFDMDEQGSTSLGIANGPKSDKPEDLAKVQTDHGDNGFYLVLRQGNNITMRRFTEHIEFVNDMKPKCTIVEVPYTSVMAERNEAYADKYGLLKRNLRKSPTGARWVNPMIATFLIVGLALIWLGIESDWLRVNLAQLATLRTFPVHVYVDENAEQGTKQYGERGYFSPKDEAVGIELSMLDDVANVSRTLLHEFVHGTFQHEDMSRELESDCFTLISKLGTRLLNLTKDEA